MTTANKNKPPEAESQIPKNYKNTLEDNSALASLALSILSLSFFFLNIIGLFFSFLSIGFGLKGLSSIYRKNFAKIGLFISVISILIILFWSILSLSLESLPLVG